LGTIRIWATLMPWLSALGAIISQPQSMPLPEDEMKPDNIISLGTETLFAIADELRRMYDADLRSKPSERLERLIQLIERGKKLP
jgi:hypothetical protein